MSEFLPYRRRLRLLGAFIAVLLGVSPSRGDGPAVEGVVVLRNGNVLAGAVRHAGPFYFIEHSGASLQVSAEQVEMACGSLAEAYELRRRDRVGASADSHLEMARWCLRHSLLDQAAREVLDARTRDPGHPALASLDTQIRQMLEIEASRRERAESVPAAAAAPLAGASNEAPAPVAPLLDPSQEAQAQFVRSIQPMLIHGCATGGCHQPDSPQQMQLDRWALDGNGNPDRIRRNLAAVLAQINAEDPASSPVLLRARQAHGARQDALSKPLATYQAALLLDWLNAAASFEPEPPMENAAPPAAGEIESPAPASNGLAPPLQPTTAPTSPPGAAFKPRDAFDPEIFNQQVAAIQAGQAASPEAVANDDEALSQSVNDEGATAPSAAE